MSYEYETAGSGTEDGRNTLRRKRLIMPNGAYVTYSFASEAHGDGHSDWASRVSSVLVDLDGSGGTYTPVSVASYAYNGTGHVVGIDYPEPDVMSLAYAIGSPNAYGNLDRFNRVVTSAWTADRTTDHDFFNVDVFYDEGSNITWVDDTILGGWDYEYTIDGLNRLTRAERDTISTYDGNGVPTALAALKFDQQWTLDQVGNWNLAKLDRNGDTDFIDTGDYNDDRTHNLVNELTGRDTDDNGTNNHNLAYFKTGALKNDGQHYKYVWDAFGRLREVLKRSDSSLVAEYTYNGLGFRTSEHHDTDTDGDVDGDDSVYHFVYDDSWRIIATYRDDDASPKEQFIHHNAGDSGYGSSSYIDAVILRDADFTSAWNAQADSTLETRHYYCQNWRADVSVIIDDSAVIVERAMYSPYGVPFGIPAGDFVTSATFAEPADGTVGSADNTYMLGAWGSGYDIADLDNDGDVDGADQTIMNNNWGATLGWGALSLNHNRLGYAGYVFDEALAGTKWHVRHRVLESVLGRWMSRDLVEYLDGGSLYQYSASTPVFGYDPLGLIGPIGPGRGFRHVPYFDPIFYRGIWKYFFPDPPPQGWVRGAGGGFCREDELVTVYLYSDGDGDWGEGIVGSGHCKVLLPDDVEYKFYDINKANNKGNPLWTPGIIRRGLDAPPDSGDDRYFAIKVCPESLRRMQGRADELHESGHRYSVFTYHCGSFCKDVLSAGNVDVPFFIDTPNEIRSWIRAKRQGRNPRIILPPTDPWEWDYKRYGPRYLCFVIGTLVHTPNGPIAIELIDSGDEVLSYDFETGCVVSAAVTEVFSGRVDTVVNVITDRNEVIRTTEFHPFWVEGKGWLPAGELRSGDCLWSPIMGDRSLVVTVENETLALPLEVHTLRVNTLRNFLVSNGGWVVHNK